MAEFETEKQVEEKAAAKRKLKAQVVSKVDTTPTNVLKWAQEGRELYFAAGEEFLELPVEVEKLLKGLSKTRYLIEKDAHNGGNPAQTATDSINGFTTNFNVRSDSPDAQLAVRGKDPRMAYHWARPDKYEQHLRKGWVVDHAKDTRTKYDEACDYKTVGGQNKPELVLMKKDRELVKKDQQNRKKMRDNLVRKAQDSFRSDVERSGGRAIVDSTNGVV